MGLERKKQLMSECEGFGKGQKSRKIEGDQVVLLYEKKGTNGLMAMLAFDGVLEGKDCQ